MYLGPAMITANETDRAANRNKKEYSSNNSDQVYYHLYDDPDYFYVERILPYLYTSLTEDKRPANGHCGEIKYFP